MFQPKAVSSPAWRKGLQGKQLDIRNGPRATVSKQAASGPLGAQLWEMVLGRSRVDGGRISLQNSLSFKELGQMAKDVQLPDHMLGLYKYSCAPGERLRPMIKPRADPV